MNRPEQQLHQAVATYLTVAMPDCVWWTTIPLGGGGRLRGVFIKSMGAKKGTPDVLVVYRGQAHFIELKSKVGRLSPEQKNARDAIRGAFARWACCRSVDEVHAQICAWEIPTRAKVAA